MRALGLVLSVLVAIVAITSPAGAQRRASEGLSAVFKTVLPNRLVVLIDEDHKAPIVSMELRYRVGVRDDPPNRRGLVALVARLMSTATRHVAAGEYEAQLERAGARESELYATVDGTRLRTTVPSNRVALPLWLWSDQMAFFGEKLDAQTLAAQLAISRNDRVTAVDNAPAGRVYEMMREELFPSGHPYRRIAFAATPDLGSVTVDEVRAFYERMYGPDSAMIVISGDVRRADAIALVEKYFGPIPAAGVAAAPARSSARPRLGGETRLRVAARVERPTLYVAWPTASWYTPGDAELDVLAQFLTGARAGVLRWALVDGKRIATEVSANQSSLELGSTFYVRIVGTEGRSHDELLAAFDEVMSTVEKRQLNEGYVSHAIADNALPKILALEETRWRADRYADFEQVLGRVDFLKQYIGRYFDVGPSGLSATAASELPLDRRVVAFVAPASDAPVAGELRAKTFALAGHR
jgi:zinc protease